MYSSLFSASVQLFAWVLCKKFIIIIFSAKQQVFTSLGNVLLPGVHRTGTTNGRGDGECTDRGGRGGVPLAQVPGGSRSHQRTGSHHCHTASVINLGDTMSSDQSDD